MVIFNNYVKLPEGILQWEFQDPKLEVPTIYKAYVREYPHKIWPEKWYSTSILGSWNSHWKYLDPLGESQENKNLIPMPQFLA